MYKSDAAFINHFKELEDPRGELSRTESIQILRKSAAEKNGYLWKLRDEAVRQYVRGKKDFLSQLNAFERELAEHFSKEVDEEIEREEMFFQFISDAEIILSKRLEDDALYRDVNDFFAYYELAAAKKMEEERRLQQAYEIERHQAALLFVTAAIDDALFSQSVCTQVLLAVENAIEQSSIAIERQTDFCNFLSSFSVDFFEKSPVRFLTIFPDKYLRLDLEALQRKASMDRSKLLFEESILYQKIKSAEKEEITAVKKKTKIGKKAQQSLEQEELITSAIAQKKQFTQELRRKKIQDLKQICANEYQTMKKISLNEKTKIFSLIFELSDYRMMEQTPTGPVLKELNEIVPIFRKTIYWFLLNLKELKEDDSYFHWVMLAYFENCLELRKLFFVLRNGRLTGNLRSEHAQYHDVSDPLRRIQVKTHICTILDQLDNRMAILFEMSAELNLFFQAIKGVYALSFDCNHLKLQNQLLSKEHFFQCLWVLKQRAIVCFSLMNWAFINDKPVLEHPAIADEIRDMHKHLLYFHRLLANESNDDIVNKVAAVISRLEQACNITSAPQYGQQFFQTRGKDANELFVLEKSVCLQAHLKQFLSSKKFVDFKAQILKLHDFYFNFVDLSGVLVKNTCAKKAQKQLLELIFISEAMVCADEAQMKVYFIVFQMTYTKYSNDAKFLHFPTITGQEIYYESQREKDKISTTDLGLFLSCLIPEALVSSSGRSLLTSNEEGLLNISASLYMNFIGYDLAVTSLNGQEDVDSWARQTALIKQSLFSLIENIARPALSQERDVAQVDRLARQVVMGLLEINPFYEKHKNIFEKEGCEPLLKTDFIRHFKAFSIAFPVNSDQPVMNRAPSA